MKKITFFGIILCLSLFSSLTKAQTNLDLTTKGGSIIMDYPAVSAQTLITDGTQWVKAVALPAIDTKDGICSGVSGTFGMKSAVTLTFYLAKCDQMVVTGNIATGRSVKVSINGGTSISVAGTGACTDVTVPVNLEVPCTIAVTGYSSSSAAYVSEFKFSYVSKTIPTILLSSGTNTQTVDQAQTLAPVVYQYGGTAISASLTWTGTADANTAPDGVIVTTNTTAKTVTISGALNTLGSYGYSITSTDGTTPATALTGSLNTTMLPTLSLTSGNLAQTVYQTQTISPIVYHYGGPTATATSIAWTGTADANTVPDGIIVTTNNTAKTITFSGALNTLGSYGYSISSTYGTTIVSAPSGTLNTKTTTKYKMAYVTAVTSGAPAPGDLYFINGMSNNPGNDGLSQYFDLTYINATDTGIDYSIYDVILESSIPASGGAGLTELKTKCLSKPFVNMKEFQLQSSAWAWGTPANTTTTTIVVQPTAMTHPIFSGITFSGTASNEIILTTATTGNMAVNLTAWGTTTPAVPTALSSVKGVTGLGGYFEIPVGTKMSGMTALTTAKQVVLGLSESTYNTGTNLLTGDAITIAVNAAKYVIAPSPVISLISGSASQVVVPSSAMSTVVYTYSGTVTATNVVWTGTSASTTAPDGITVITDAVGKTITISGTPTTAGVYGFSVSATDGGLTPVQNGTLNVNTTTGIENSFTSKTVVSKVYYDITGNKMPEYAKGILIEKSVYSDGSNSYKKIFRANN